MPRLTGYSYERHHTSPAREFACCSEKPTNMHMPAFNVMAAAGGALIGYTFARPQPCWMCIGGGALIAGVGVPMLLPSSDNEQKAAMSVLIAGAAGAGAQAAGFSREVQMAAAAGGGGVSYLMPKY